MNYSSLIDQNEKVVDPFQISKSKIESAVQEFTMKFEHWEEMLETTNTASNKDFSILTNELKQEYKDIKKALKELKKWIDYAHDSQKEEEEEKEEKKTTTITSNIESINEFTQQNKFVIEMTQIMESCSDSITSQRTKQMIQSHKQQIQQQQNKVEVVLGDIHHSNQERKNPIKQTEMQLIRNEQKKEQEEILGDMLSVLKLLGMQGHFITGELEEQNLLLNEMGSEFNTTQSRLVKLANKLDALMDHSESKKMFVIIVLVVILMIIIYFMF